MDKVDIVDIVLCMFSAKYTYRRLSRQRRLCRHSRADYTLGRQC